MRKLAEFLIVVVLAAAFTLMALIICELVFIPAAWRFGR